MKDLPLLRSITVGTVTFNGSDTEKKLFKLISDIDMLTRADDMKIKV